MAPPDDPRRLGGKEPDTAEQPPADGSPGPRTPNRPGTGPEGRDAPGAEPESADRPGVEPGGAPPQETPPVEPSTTTDLAATSPEEKARGWARTPVILVLASAFLVTFGLVAMVVSRVVD
ncbi:hypothetical protein AQ490_25845 [Wenjunlia vitaminophila]|uniref:Uncharacterized protein n=1 Tax=Wenjunlia vitaminophila TaxID=76728 RepID=A0A0T6LQQ7_WENVI|nr:DUF6480 family protein [Wenjunlia vitaminophila]KRV48225.1 hypothetical protein AQ490_25845 [Wenjunlia vitaminophila]